ncbi:MAG: hypothetical protein ABSE06_11485 [Anaerolineaceae bacterium]|jgi:hypothetical protein
MPAVHEVAKRAGVGSIQWIEQQFVDRKVSKRVYEGPVRFEQTRRGLAIDLPEQKPGGVRTLLPSELCIPEAHRKHAIIGGKWYGSNCKNPF